MLLRFVAAIFLTLMPQQLSAQGVFDTFGFPKTVTATGHTEVIGSVHLALRLGTTLPDTLVIDVSPLRITNTSAADIEVTTAGSLTTGAVQIQAAQGRVRIPINGGATSGSLRVDGIRVSVADTNVSSISARLTWANLANFFTSTAPVVVVDQVKSGLVVDPMTDLFSVFANVVQDDKATIVIREGYAGAFVDTEDFGQDTATQIRIRVTDLPTGLKMHFPESILSEETGAELTTLEGTAIDLPRSDGSAEVTYIFDDTATSPTTLESFKIEFTVSAQGHVEIIQPTIELSLAPIGAAEPTDALPSTDIPRYAEDNIIALAGTAVTVSKRLYWTGIDNTRSNSISLFNPSSRTASLNLAAFNAAGQLISGTSVQNPVLQTLSPNQSSVQLLTAIFGSGIGTNVASVRIESTVQEVVGTGNVSGSGVAESVALLDRGLSTFVLPLPGPDSRVHLFNPENTAVTGTLTLIGTGGAVLGTFNANLAATASLNRTVQDLFGTTAGGEVVALFANPVVGFGTFGPATSLNLYASEFPALVGNLIVPFVVTGGGYETELTFANRIEEPVTLSAQFVNTQGSAVGAARSITLRAGEQTTSLVSQLFGFQTFTAGYIRIQVPPKVTAFFVSYPPIVGYARIRTAQTASTLLPVAAYSQSSVAVLGSGTTASHYQGIAVVNPNSAEAVVTIEAIGAGGNLIASANTTIPAGGLFARLLSELFTVAIPEGSVIRVTSPSGVVTTSIIGSWAGDTLRALPAQR